PGARRSLRLSKFSLYLLAMVGGILAFIASFFMVIHAEGQLQQTNETRLKSLLLADELRQSSNDLTRLVRTYVITGDPAFKRQFEAVHEIRDGKRARPIDYGPSYWDFHAIDTARDSGDGPALPLLEVMRRAGFTEAELQRLAAAKLNSDALTKIEYAAMALVEQAGPTDDSARERAIAMLHDAAFHRAKVDIMRPIVEFDRLVNARTLEAVQSARGLTQRVRFVQIVLGALLIYLLWLVYRELHVILGGSVAELQKTIARLGAGDFSSPIAVPADRKDSVLAWVRDTQASLARMELMQFRAIVNSSDDAIISKTPEGIITSWNAGAERLFGYTADEVIGQPMLLLMPPDRRDEEPQILARIARGERVDHFETVRRRKDGQLIDVSVTISPIRDASGRVVGASKIARDITSAKEAEAEIHRLAFYDPLTGLPNRRLLQDRLAQALSVARRQPQFCVVLFIDLDNFKSLNDTRGHDIGDLLLREVAHRLRGCVRTGDTVARFGGDEFVVLLVDASRSELQTAGHAEIVGQKILEQLSQPYELAGTTHFCTPSIGVAIQTGPDTTADELLKQADVAMYQSKAAGRNTLRFFDPRMQTAVDHSVIVDRELREALRLSQFELYIQPQVWADGRIRGGEALLRWQHPTRGLVLPGDFIAQAEESGLIVPIGAWVLEQACRQLAAWADQPAFADITLAVNVSAKQLRESPFTDQVLAVLDQTGADPRRLMLELTESSLATHLESIIGKMNILRTRGLRFSLDDFGTGYSSLAYLKRMPLAELKIDRGFVKDLLVDPNDAAIARMVAVLAASLGIEAIAEGVENEAQRDALAQMGCHAYQGYLFGRPMPVAQFETLALRNAERAG
ncbi:MAG TPA: EAL domain-containing protein, partial [Methylibium sp.]|nr:EAL domain-containing protein [Methylibium sp.]